ncbi:MAG TPA: glycoside hydrolase family 28 protein [Opitutaceae bacterium]
MTPLINRRRFFHLSGAIAATTSLRAAMTGSATSPENVARPSLDAIVARIRPPVFAPRDIAVTDFGARPNGGVDARPAVQLAIRHCNATGGGRVVVPRGVWDLVGPLHLLSRVHLHLEDGAHLRFVTDDPSRYLPVVLSRWEGTEFFNYSPFIYAYQAHNVAITGAGTIDGNAHDTFVKWRPRQAEDQLALRKMGAESVPVAERVFGAGHWLRPPLVQFFGCTNVLMDGPRLIDSPFWVIHAVACTNVTLRRVQVDSPHLNSDGFDPESCTDVLVEDCVFRTGDDCIAIKSGRDQDAWRIGRPTENVVIRRCELNAPSAGSGLALGSEMSGGIANVFVEDLRMGYVKSAINFKSNLDRGGLVEGVSLQNITVEKADILLQVTTGYHGYRGGNFPPTFRGFTFEDIRCQSADVPISVVGVPAAKVQDFTMRNLTVERAEKSAVVRNVRNLRADNVVVGGQPLAFAADID